MSHFMAAPQSVRSRSQRVLGSTEKQSVLPVIDRKPLGVGATASSGGPDPFLCGVRISARSVTGAHGPASMKTTEPALPPVAGTSDASPNIFFSLSQFFSPYQSRAQASVKPLTPDPGK